MTAEMGLSKGDPMRILIAICLVLAPSALFAQWTADPQTFVTIADAPGSQQDSHSISDGADGMITVWEDGRNGPRDIYAQRVDANGIPQWQANGIPVVIAAQVQTGSAIVPDGAGGVIVGWLDNRDNPNSVYAQRVDSNGNVLWEANGVEVVGDSAGANYLEVVGDGAGGAYLAWSQGGVLNGQHIAGDGTVTWSLPVTIRDAANGQSETIGMPHPAGGATFAWVDRRNLGNPKLYAQHVRPDGTTAWIDNGVPLAFNGVDQRNVSMVSDGAGGYLFAWQEYRDAPTLGINLYGQRLLPSGAIAWGSGGRVICAAPNTQNSPSMVASPGGGALLTWGDWRLGGSSLEQVYAQRIDVDGNPLWPVDGIRVAPVDHAQNRPILAGDGTGGAHVFWQAQGDLYAQSLAANGDILGSPTGELFIAHSQGDYTESAVATSDGGAIAVVAPSNANLYCDKLGGGAAPMFVRGDVNTDGTVDISDAQSLLGFLFVIGSPEPDCQAAADTNAGGTIDVSDVVYLLNYLFVAGPPPSAPFPNCGADPTTPLTCDSFSACP